MDGYLDEEEEDLQLIRKQYYKILRTSLICMNLNQLQLLINYMLISEQGSAWLSESL
jgi:hypothetical protein